MGSLGTPSWTAFITITFIASITALTSGFITQYHPVLDVVLNYHAMLSHPASLTILTCSPVGSCATDQGRCRGDGPEAPSLTFTIHSGPTHLLLFHVLCCVFSSLLCASASLSLL